jgi:peptidoglycan-associated lipoprotein
MRIQPGTACILSVIGACLLLIVSCGGKTITSDDHLETATSSAEAAQTPEVPPETSESLPSSAESELPEGWQAIEDTTVYFRKGRSALGPEATQTLQQAARWLRANPQVTIVIEGYSDEPGTAEYNFALGDRRAGSVVSFFLEQGIDISRMTAVSFGKEKPAVPGSDETARSRNRRVEITIDRVE